MKNLYLILVISFVHLNSANAQNKQTCNCCTEKHAEFDFWVGKWTVTNPDGSPAGKNTIEKVQGECLLRENWTSASPGFTGTSNNFYNYKTKQWEQIWVDNQGQSLHLKGNRKGNQMILQTDEETNTQGQKFYHRVTWTLNNDGTVRQFWETITEGQDVTIASDGPYKKSER